MYKKIYFRFLGHYSNKQTDRVNFTSNLEQVKYWNTEMYLFMYFVHFVKNILAIILFVIYIYME